LGVPVLGICWYPSVSCPDWHDPTSVFPAGLWDVVPSRGQLRRVPAAPVLAAVREVQQELGAEAPSAPTDQPEATESRLPAVSVEQLRRDTVARCPRMPDNFARAFLLAGEHLAVSVYRLDAGQSVSTRSYPDVEIALCVTVGAALVCDWEAAVPLSSGEVMVIPAGTSFGLSHAGTDTCLILQVAAPPPWSADFQGPEPANAILTSDIHDPAPLRGSDST